MSLQIIDTFSEGLKRGFTVIVPLAEIEGRHAAKLSKIEAVARQGYSTIAMAEVLEESVNEAAQQIVADRGLRLAAQPKVDVITLPKRPDERLEKEQNLKFKVEVELLPDISIPEFASFALTRFTAEPKAEAINNALIEIAARQSSLVLVEEARGAARGETLIADFTGRLGDTAFTGGAGTDVSIEIGGPGFIPGFTEQFEGMAAGETREIQVTFPEDYGSKDLAGKVATFEITAKILQRPVPAALDDALAAKLGFGTLDELRGHLGQQMAHECDQMSRMRLKHDLLDLLLSSARFAVPVTMVENEFQQIWQGIGADLRDGRLDAEDKEQAALRTDYRAIAERRVRLGLLLAEIGRAEGIKVGADEMTRAMLTEAARYQGHEDQLTDYFAKNPQATESLRGSLFEEKVVDFILKQVSIEEKAVTPEELAAERAT